MEDELQGEGLEIGSLVQKFYYHGGVSGRGFEFRERQEMGIEAEMRTFREEGLTGLDGGYLKERVVEISSLGRNNLLNKDCEYINDRNGEVQDFELTRTGPRPRPD